MRSRSQRLALARECSAWLIARGYERDLSWLAFSAPESGTRKDAA
ncbi:MAG TPA: hypothetical protein VML55_20960 [Planctomycetaceae bacterium]|nr:hypothetical protein [Planctomycetaceae bacterium]